MENCFPLLTSYRLQGSNLILNPGKQTVTKFERASKAWLSSIYVKKLTMCCGAMKDNCA